MSEPSSDLRRVHLVGTVPAPDTRAALEIFAEHLGEQLPLWIPDGETGDRLDWVERIIEGLGDHPDLVTAKEGDWSDYEKTPRFAVAPGHRFASLELDYTRNFQASWPEFLSFRSRHGEDRLFQVGIPSQLDLSLIAFGFKPVQGLRNLAPFRDATVREITRIHAVAGEDVVFQLEIPIPLILLTRVPAPLRPVVAGRLAAELVKAVRRSPTGTRFGIHLCYGDMNHKSMGDPEDSLPLVQLANAIIETWPHTQKLEFVHAPFARGEVPPTLDPDFYRPLAQLRLPPEVRFAAGFIHEERSMDELVQLRELIEDTLGRQVDVGASCGLGRRDQARAVANLDLSAAVATRGR